MASRLPAALLKGAVLSEGVVRLSSAGEERGFVLSRGAGNTVSGPVLAELSSRRHAGKALLHWESLWP
jgi:hypothetical protein